MRAHQPMQIDTPLHMMNSAVLATIQSDVEKRRTSWAKDDGSWKPFTSPLAYANSASRRLLAEDGCWCGPRSRSRKGLLAARASNKTGSLSLPRANRYDLSPSAHALSTDVDYVATTVNRARTSTRSVWQAQPAHGKSGADCVAAGEIDTLPLKRFWPRAQ